MKKVVTVQEVDGEGLDHLLGQNVVLWCMNFIYSGKLTGANKTCVLLEDAVVVYETGALDSKSFKDAQKVSDELYVQTSAIEAFYKRNF